MDLQAIQDYKDAQQAQADAQALQDAQDQNAQSVAKAVVLSGGATNKTIAEAGSKTERAVTDSAEKVSSAVDKGSSLTVDQLKLIKSAVESIAKDIVIPEVVIPGSVEVSNFPAAPKPVDSVAVNNMEAIKPFLQPIVDALKKLPGDIKFDPTIEVAASPVNVTTPEVDLAPLLKAVQSLETEVKALRSKKDPVFDISEAVKAANATTKAINGLSFPAPNYVLPFKNNEGGASQVQLDASGALPTGGLLSGVAYDDIVFSSEDANNNPQVATVKSHTVTVAALAMTYNTDSKLTRIRRTA